VIPSGSAATSADNFEAGVVVHEQHANAACPARQDRPLAGDLLRP
jgi:hypothetical protein